MTRSTLLISHGAVFAVGIAAAMIANHARPAGPGGGDSAAASGSRSGASAIAGAADGVPSRGGRGEREADAAGRGSGSAVARIEAIARTTDPVERQRMLMELIDKLGPNEFAEVADRFRELDHLGDARGEFALLLRGWAKVDPLGALAYAEGKPGEGRARATILETWAAADAVAAERWALDNFSGEGANPLLAAVIAGIAPHDMNHAARLVQTMEGGRERGDAIEAITRALLVKGIDAAMAFPESISDENLRAGFVASIAQRLSGKDPLVAANWVASMEQGAVQNRAARTVADALARQDPQQAATWVAKLQPEARAEAARGVIPLMSRQDIAGTARWVSTLAGTPNYDRVVEEFVWSCDQRAPEQSAIWIQGVSDPQRQRQLYHRMLNGWAQRDQEAMRQWVASNDVPADVRRRFLR